MQQDLLQTQLHNQWGWIVVRGVAAVAFGVLAIVMPGITIITLTLLWGAFMLVDGILAMVTAFRIRDQGRPLFSFVIVGVLGIAAGIVTFFWPGMTALALLLFIAGWSLAMGVFQIVTAIRFRKAMENEWLLALSGLVAVLFGSLMLVNPGAGALALVWIIASYAIIFGVLLVAFGIRVKRAHKFKPAMQY